MKQIQKLMGFELYIDLNGHPIEKYLLYSSHKINAEQNMGFYAYDESPHHGDIIRFLLNKTVVRIETNYYPSALDEETKQFMRDFLQLNPEYAEHFKKRNVYNYHLYHFRFGDKYICQENDSRFKYITIDFQSCIDKYLQTNPNTTSIIISDSLEFKKMCNNIATVYLNEPIHTRFNDNPKINNDITETINDFYLIQNATKVYAYSTYPWVSNFILWTSIIYDVPIERL